MNSWLFVYPTKGSREGKFKKFSDIKVCLTSPHLYFAGRTDSNSLQHIDLQQVLATQKKIVCYRNNKLLYKENILRFNINKKGPYLCRERPNDNVKNMSSLEVK